MGSTRRPASRRSSAPFAAAARLRGGGSQPLPEDQRAQALRVGTCHHPRIAGPPVDPEVLAPYHAYIREHGPSLVLGLAARLTLLPLLLVVNRLRRVGRDS